MTDRDRLAADLAQPDEVTTPIGSARRRWWRLGWLSANAVNLDRLIALGWTRLDEERLARALTHVINFNGLSVTVLTTEGIRTLVGDAEIAAAIAKAYREDSE